MSNKEVKKRGFERIKEWVKNPGNTRVAATIFLFLLAWLTQYYAGWNIAQKIAFWVGLIISALLLIRANYLENKNSDSQTKRILDSSREIHEFTKRAAKDFRNMPPHRFLEEHSRLIQNSHLSAIRTDQYAKAKDDDERRAVLEKKIRMVLNDLVAMAQIYDEEDSEESTVEYHINIMLRTSPGDLPKEAKDSFIKCAHFMRETTSPDKMDSLLVLAPNLSTDTSKKDPDPDNSIEIFGLGIRHIDETVEGEIKKLLPGAPRALYSQFEEYTDTTDLINACFDSSEVDITREEAGKIKNYFEGTDNGRMVRSFLSIPLRLALPGNVTVTVGVVNIHRNVAMPSEGRYPTKTFVNLSKPFLLHLLHLVVELDELDKEYLNKVLLGKL